MFTDRFAVGGPSLRNVELTDGAAGFGGWGVENHDGIVLHNLTCQITTERQEVAEMFTFGKMTRSDDRNISSFRQFGCPGGDKLLPEWKALSGCLLVEIVPPTCLLTK